MGATNNIKDTNIRLKLTDLSCSQCSQNFIKEEIAEGNYDIWFDTTNDVKLNFPFGRSGYQLTIWIRSIEHKDCPEDNEDHDK